MHLRLVRIKARVDKLPQLIGLYETEVITSLQSVHGCRYAGFMQSAHHADECLSLTLWDSPADTEAYEQSGLFTLLLNQSKPYLLESSEFRIQLSEKLTLEYVPVPEEPVVSAMPVSATGSADAQRRQAGAARWLRTVALKLRPGKMEAFKQTYINHVIPALREVKGCRYIYLTENPGKPNEVISITSWESEEDAKRYEQGGLFREILESQHHLLSELYQWRRAEDKIHAGSVATSEDMTVEHYTVLVGKEFNQGE